jgi:cell division protein ZapE
MALRSSFSTVPVDTPSFIADAGQEPVMQALDDLLRRLKPLTRRSLWPWPHKAEKRGLYIHGPVGRGKTMLMDRLYDGAEGIKKRRVHFHEFMLEVHRRLHEQSFYANRDALRHVADDLSKEARLLCFDEFQVYNVADAMILSRFFRELFDQGVVIVATSNVAPEDLYRDGLQRVLFLPFIELLKEKLDVVPIGEGRDYRQSRIKGMPVYLTPANDQAHTHLRGLFRHLTDAEDAGGVDIQVDGRKLHVPRAAKRVAWFSFDDLCKKALGAADYLALADRFHTIIVENVPLLGERNKDETLRFIHLVDVLYDRHINLIVSAAAAIEKLFDGDGDLAARFTRTASRLNEMQSEAYLMAPHAGQTAP